MKFLWVLIFLNFRFYLSLCYHFVNNKDSNVTIIAKVLHDIVDEFLIKENIRFDIKILNKISQFQQDILTDFMSNVNGKFSYNLTFKDLSMETRNTALRLSNIFIIESIEDVPDIGSIHYVVRYPNQPLK